MLLVVLLLVLVAAATLVAAVFGAGAGFAWTSVLASVLGAALLVVDRLRTRRSRTRTTRVRPQGEEPGEERSNAAEAADPDAEVVVIDERPRYHVRTCDWLGEADALPLTLVDARGLGFTPCARCAPNATIAAEPRRSR
ncbi:hypothetical protein EIL87_13440 [Saccharopolyspora rhizosphaerae]|uniref:Uncharacterized protein n=1 Tax=Saccharopolyspora rhizosphaerae TaxID=2492662 RepID=A0A3R8VEU1_9PSEU|nr:hypothetical protein [Saccharopolyspora rhizosphaerae]RRO16071.1 hypothetical protein EIL87_13440 [Saccharopolyspora rhizosphaerae]